MRLKFTGLGLLPLAYMANKANPHSSIIGIYAFHQVWVVGIV